MSGTPLPDDEFLVELGFVPEDFTSPAHKAAVLASLGPKRATLERMIGLETELELHAAGLGPKPAGVLVDYDRPQRRKR